MGSASKTPHMQGGFSSLFDAIPAQCIKIPDHVSYQAAALAEPLAVCLHAVARAGDVNGQACGAVRSGPIGLLTMLAAKRAGHCRDDVVDIAAAAAGVSQRGWAPDHVIDISKGEEALKAVAPYDVAFEVSRHGGGSRQRHRRGQARRRRGPDRQSAGAADSDALERRDGQGDRPARLVPLRAGIHDRGRTDRHRGVDVLSLVTAETPVVGGARLRSVSRLDRFAERQGRADGALSRTIQEISR
jgi:hypothetical protein